MAAMFHWLTTSGERYDLVVGENLSLMGMATGENMSTLEPISTECEPSFSILFVCVGRFSAPNVLVTVMEVLNTLIVAK